MGVREYARSVAIGMNGGQWDGSNLGFSHRAARFVMRILAAVTGPARQRLNRRQSASGMYYTRPFVLPVLVRSSRGRQSRDILVRELGISLAFHFQRGSPLSFASP